MAAWTTSERALLDPVIARLGEVASKFDFGYALEPLRDGWQVAFGLYCC